MTLIVGIHTLPRREYGIRGAWGFYRWNDFNGASVRGIGLNLGRVGLHVAWA